MSPHRGSTSRHCRPARGCISATHAVIELTGLREPCVLMDRFQQGLKAATQDRDADGNVICKAGVMAVVVADGEVAAGDAIEAELAGRWAAAISAGVTKSQSAVSSLSPHLARGEGWGEGRGIGLSYASRFRTRRSRSRSATSGERVPCPHPPGLAALAGRPLPAKDGERLRTPALPEKARMPLS